MAIVKINEPGFDSFNGDIGGIEFENGVSIRDLSPLEVNRLSAAMRVETLEGEQLGVAAAIAANRDTPLSNEAERTVTAESENANFMQAPEGSYTRESLGEIADKKGIAGLREIAEPMGVKGVSIAALIDGILEKSKV